MKPYRIGPFTLTPRPDFCRGMDAWEVVTAKGPVVFPSRQDAEDAVLRLMETHTDEQVCFGAHEGVAGVSRGVAAAIGRTGTRVAGPPPIGTLTTRRGADRGPVREAVGNAVAADLAASLEARFAAKPL